MGKGEGEGETSCKKYGSEKTTSAPGRSDRDAGPPGAGAKSQRLRKLFMNFREEI